MRTEKTNHERHFELSVGGGSVELRAPTGGPFLYRSRATLGLLLPTGGRHALHSGAFRAVRQRLCHAHLLPAEGTEELPLPHGGPRRIRRRVYPEQVRTRTLVRFSFE